MLNFEYEHGLGKTHLHVKEWLEILRFLRVNLIVFGDLVTNNWCHNHMSVVRAKYCYELD